MHEFLHKAGQPWRSLTAYPGTTGTAQAVLAIEPVLEALVSGPTIEWRAAVIPEPVPTVGASQHAFIRMQPAFQDSPSGAMGIAAAAIRTDTLYICLHLYLHPSVHGKFRLQHAGLLGSLWK